MSFIAELKRAIQVEGYEVSAAAFRRAAELVEFDAIALAD